MTPLVMAVIFSLKCQQTPPEMLVGSLKWRVDLSDNLVTSDTHTHLELHLFSK